VSRMYDDFLTPGIAMILLVTVGLTLSYFTDNIFIVGSGALLPTCSVFWIKERFFKDYW
jgi:hypothetical protein